MNKTRHYIRILLLVLLLLAGGGTGNVAWAKKVTYHILTKPFTVRNYNNTGDKWSYIRVEALQCTSDESVVGLPDQFKSPLATNFQYWKTATSEYNYLYDYANNDKIVSSKYYIYVCTKDNDFACLSEKIEISEETPISTDADGIPSDIYVTYDYINDVSHEGYDKTVWKNNLLELNGETDYNVTVNISSKQRFMCFNRSRNNRVANALASALTGEQLVDDNFVVPDNTGNKFGWSWGSWGPIGIHLGFKFLGEDPYNITIMTSYLGDEVHVSDAITTVDVTPYSSTNSNKATIKPYKGATLFGKLGNNQMWFDASNDRHYKVLSGCGQNDWKDGNKYEACKARYDATPEQARYDTWVGFYRSETPTMNSYALLPYPNTDGEYLFVGSKLNQGDSKSTQPTIYQPDKNGQYALYNDNSNNPYFKFQALSSAYKTHPYEIRSYTLYIKTHGSETKFTKTMKWSDAMASDKIVDHIPEALKRKYCSYKAYSDEALTNEITSFTDAINNAKDANGQLDPEKLDTDKKSIVIWLDYTVLESLPFETLQAVNGVYNYQDARWYTMRMNGKVEQQNIAYKKSSGSDDFITYPTKGSNSNLHSGETCDNSSNAMVAFIGDPYELKIISRAASETAVANRYIGCDKDALDNTTLNTNKEDISTNIITWEIVYENTDMGNFVLREFKTCDNPKYIGWGSTDDKPVTYSTTSSRIRVVELEKVTYKYYIVRNDAGDIAVWASANHDVGKALSSWKDIPEVIRSPFLASSSPLVTYYASLANAMTKDDAITNAPYNSDKIFVRYGNVSAPNEYYNVKLNNDYIYTEGENIKSKPLLDDGNAVNPAYKWKLNYGDPYHMTIYNEGKNKYVNVSFSNDAAISWSDTQSYFVAKSGALDGTYEVMAATGDGESFDASKIYYNIGRPAENTVKLYSNSSYQYGNAVLRFQLIATDAKDVVYHLIDKAGKDLLQATTRQLSTDNVAFPPEYYSPLVSSYHYYNESDFDKNPGDIYTLKSSEQTELKKVGDASQSNETYHIYVTYDVNDLVNLKSGQLYLLKYEAGEKFRQEDGNNGLLPEPTKAENDMNEAEKAAYIKQYQAVYPYVNGDGNFFVYGEAEREVQQYAASSRTRWVWYVQSTVDEAHKGDPYHVTIKSYQTENFPIINFSKYNCYFMTYKPDDYDKVITTLGWPGMSAETATEYMVLGSEGQYQLVTTYPVDKNNNGTVDTGEERYAVNSFEQYWKTYDTIKKKLLSGQLKDCDEKEQTDRVDGSITVPETLAKLRETLTKTKLEGGEYEFHSYEKWAYAKRWNGYNNGYSSKVGTPEKKKGWETIEHWYQTVSMGEGYFDFVKTNVDPVLILLDQHGWEIMRKPLPSSPDDPEKDAKYEAIRLYNSPMVKEYAFWATFKKRTGFHQYYMLSDRIGGNDYTSTDLTKLPPYESANVRDKNGNLNDQYVTYLVKDEYVQTYNPANKTAKPFLIEQGSMYASTSDGTTITKNKVSSVGSMKEHITNDAISDEEKWYVKPNSSIDDEMGYGDEDVPTTWTEKKDGKWVEQYPNVYEHYAYKNAPTAQYIFSNTDSLGYFAFSNGFDPYNIQIESVSASSKYMKTNATGAILNDGSMSGVYSTTPAISLGDNSTPITPAPKSYQELDLAVTNATFMAVQDANGNMQLMPRFDHDRRMSEFSTLKAPTDEAISTTYTKLYRPVVYDYRIIDNIGHESLRYKSGGDLLPQTPDHFKSPLAKNFKYYATATQSSSTYSNIKDEIKESLDGVSAKLEKENDMGIVYVRYEYDEDADNLNILKGNWLTMQLDNKTAQYTTVDPNSGIYSSLTKSYSLTATNLDDLNDQAKKLTDTTVDYYFKVGTTEPYTYYKVKLTNIVDEVLAVSTTTTEDNSTNWNNSTEKLTAANDDDLEYQAKRLTGTGDYYFRVGTTEPYTYKKVHVTTAYKASYAECTKTEEDPISNSSNWDASKPLVVNADGKKWQWKFLKNQQSTPDPYAVYLFNRDKKDQELPNSLSRFAILSHSSGDYALAKAGLGTYTYQFLNGDGQMSISKAAEIAKESGFTSSTNNFSGTNSQVKLTDEVQYAFTYKVYTNTGKFAIKADQTQEEVDNNDWATRIPDEIKTPLLNLDQFRYYSKDNVTYGAGDPEPAINIASINPNKNLSHLYGLYDDEVVVRYTPYNPSVTEYQVPNVRNATSETKVAKGIGSNDAPLDLSEKLAYNVIWYNDNMMTTTNGSNVVGHADQAITTDKKYEWRIGGNDPYAIKFYNVNAEKYITAASVADGTTCTLDASATTFMLLPKANYDYGILAITGNKDSKLTIPDDGTDDDDAAKITTGDPAEFIIFALSTHKVIYHLMIKNIGHDIIVPYYRGTNLNATPEVDKKVESGSTLRDLYTYDETGYRADHPDGDFYQLGETLKAIGVRAGATTTSGLYAKKIDNEYGTIYCYDAGRISLGDKLEVPSVFYRPNVKYRFIIEGVYDSSGTVVTEMNNKYKGWETKNMGDDEGLLHNTVFVNIVYSFDTGLGTNSGSGFVTSVDDNKWYSFDTKDATPQLAEYTAQVKEDEPKIYKTIKTKSGYATHYTNDYLWTPVGDPYGFKMYNRYACKNLGETTMVMTTKSVAAGEAVMMGDEENNGEGNGRRDIYELVANSTTTPGYFRVHPMMNKSGIQYYMNSNSSTGALTLSITPTEWEFGLKEEMMRPYREAAGYVGGLNADGKDAYDEALKETNPLKKLMDIQNVVYNHDNDNSDQENPNYIVHYAPRYYRLHSQPGSQGITTPRYASGYTHKIELTEKDENNNTAIPMHFYEVPEYTILNPEFRDLGAGNYTISPATRGNIPLSTVTSDPASIFMFTGDAPSSVTMRTQGLYVKENKMTTPEGVPTSFSIIDLGGGVIALQSGTGALTSFLNYNQKSKKYDLKFNTAVDLNDAVLSGADALESTRWCMQPVQKDVTAGDGEMELQIPTNNDGKDNFFTTFCAPFDVLLTNPKDEAFVLPTGGWPTTTPATIHPKKIGQYNTGTYAGNSRFIPAGTPVIIRTSNDEGYVTMALPNATPSAPLASGSCIFSGEYLEQMLSHDGNFVYVFGRSLGTFKKDANFDTNGLLSTTPVVSTDVGFYVNANPNKEANEDKASWTRNNKYVLGNKIYYHASGGSARQGSIETMPDFIPVVFDDDDEEEDEPIGESLLQRPHDNRVYDLLGRCVASGEEVVNGTWRHKVASGIYILNGRKIYVK